VGFVNSVRVSWRADLSAARADGRVLAIEVKLADRVEDIDAKHLHWLRDRIGNDLIDAVVIYAGERAYRRRDEVAVVPLALLGPWRLARTGRVSATVPYPAGRSRGLITSLVWASPARPDGRPAPCDEPPAWPAEQTGEIPLEISDDIGTFYQRHCGRAGGHGTEFETRWAFLPTPSAQTTRLTLRFTPHAGTPVEVELPLPRGPNAADGDAAWGRQPRRYRPPDRGQRWAAALRDKASMLGRRAELPMVVRRADT
jgi:hypothetical protein